MKLLKIGVLIIAILYFVWPIDLIPDIIPVVGYLDDIAVAGAAILYYLRG